MLIYWLYQPGTPVRVGADPTAESIVYLRLDPRRNGGEAAVEIGHRLNRCLPLHSWEHVQEILIWMEHMYAPEWEGVFSGMADDHKPRLFCALRFAEVEQASVYYEEICESWLTLNQLGYAHSTGGNSGGGDNGRATRAIRFTKQYFRWSHGFQVLWPDGEALIWAQLRGNELVLALQCVEMGVDAERIDETEVPWPRSSPGTSYITLNLREFKQGIVNSGGLVEPGWTWAANVVGHLPERVLWDSSGRATIDLELSDGARAHRRSLASILAAAGETAEKEAGTASAFVLVDTVAPGVGAGRYRRASDAMPAWGFLIHRSTHVDAAHSTPGQSASPLGEAGSAIALVRWSTAATCDETTTMDAAAFLFGRLRVPGSIRRESSRSGSMFHMIAEGRTRDGALVQNVLHGGIVGGLMWLSTTPDLARCISEGLLQLSEGRPLSCSISDALWCWGGREAVQSVSDWLPLWSALTEGKDWWIESRADGAGYFLAPGPTMGSGR